MRTRFWKPSASHEEARLADGPAVAALREGAEPWPDEPRVAALPKLEVVSLERPGAPDLQLRRLRPRAEDLLAVPPQLEVVVARLLHGPPAEGRHAMDPGAVGGRKQQRAGRHRDVDRRRDVSGLVVARDAVRVVLRIDE